MVDPPDGLTYRPEFIAAADEQRLLATLEELRFDEIRMRGQAARRTARHFGIDYDYDQPGRITPAEPMPEWLASLRDGVAELAEVESDEFVEALVQRYPPGATIGWHRDAPMFGRVAGLSLGAACRMRFRQPSGDRRDVFELELEPRSAYVLRGAARWAWQHSIPATKTLRFSITFRTLRDRRQGGQR